VEAARGALEPIDGRPAYRPAVVAHDLWLASGLEAMLPETVLMCVQRSSAVDVLRQRGIDVFCLSEHVPADQVAGRSSADLFQHRRAIEFCRQHGPLAVMTFKPSERFEAAVRSASSRLIAGGGSRHMAVARSFENKLHFVEIAARLGLPTPRWEVVSVTELDDYAGLARRFGERMVIQGPRGNAGQRTWMVSSPVDLEQARRRETGPSVRVAQHVGGTPFTVNGVAHREGLLSWAEPSRQVTGEAWLTPMALGSCGNAWGEPALDPYLAGIGRATAVLGEALGTAGFTGVFGIDFVLGADGPLVVETNPRMVASLPLATQVEMAAGRVPLLLQTLLLGLGVAEDRLVEPGPVDAPAASPLAPTSQVIVHRLGDDPEPRPATASGVYRLASHKAPQFLRPGAWLSDLAADDEVLLLIREDGEPVTVGKEYARVYMRGAGAEHTPGLRELVDSLRGP
jgi:predicted ATP-grasp superfamily ATP-dependent carboligase